MARRIPDRGRSDAAFIRNRIVVDETTDCWKWTGPLTGDGYGSINRSGHRLSHRLAFVTFVGPIPTGMHLDHLCRVRSCCNPEHLEPVTSRTNTLRSPSALPAINARKEACVNGHAFDEANTYLTSTGKRHCRTCRHDAVRRYRARNTA